MIKMSFQEKLSTWEHQNTVLVDPRDVIKVLQMTQWYKVYEAPFAFIYATGKLWLTMWQLHLPYNIQNATYLKSETDIYRFFFFSCNNLNFFSLLFLKQEQQQYWPANRFNGYFRIEKNNKKIKKPPQHRNSTRRNSTVRDRL